MSPFIKIKFNKRSKIEIFKSVNNGLMKLPYVGKKLKNFQIIGEKDFFMTCNFCKNKHLKILKMSKSE